MWVLIFHLFLPIKTKIWVYSLYNFVQQDRSPVKLCIESQGLVIRVHSIQLKWDASSWDETAFSQEWLNRFGWNFACTNISAQCAQLLFQKKAKHCADICACKISAKSILPFMRKTPSIFNWIHPSWTGLNVVTKWRRPATVYGLISNLFFS